MNVAKTKELVKNIAITYALLGSIYSHSVQTTYHPSADFVKGLQCPSTLEMMLIDAADLRDKPAWLAACEAKYDK